jgi:DNA-directed RNA polymerase specialized sigma54-like protein
MKSEQAVLPNPCLEEEEDEEEEEEEEEEEPHSIGEGSMLPAAKKNVGYFKEPFHQLTYQLKTHVMHLMQMRPQM